MTSIIDRLDNWAAWARDHQIIPISCRSLESNYKHPPTGDSEGGRVIDMRDALEIEKILTGETFPKANMACIVYSYVYPQLNFHAALRKINRFRVGLEPINRKNFAEFERQSERMIINRLSQ